MLVVVLAGAVVFDLCHNQEPKQLTTKQSEAGKHKLDSQVFFYNPGSSFKIRTGTDKLFSKILFTIGQDKFLAAFHNQKAFDLIKSESLKVGSPLNPMVHFRKFIICHHAASDDNFPLL
jgi:hypothetical protein